MATDDLHDCNAVAKALVEKFVAISLPPVESSSPSDESSSPSDESSSPLDNPSSSPSDDHESSHLSSSDHDSVYAYAVYFLTMGLL